MPSAYDHFMIDIETYDTSPSAVILSIGAENILGVNTFYCEVDPNTQHERTVSQDTKNWWAQQGNPPIHGFMQLVEVLAELSNWIKALSNEPVIWCKGTDFDVTILAHAYKSFGMEVPWKYNNVRDCRTIFKLCNAPKVAATHNALEDAQAQSDELVRCLNKLNVELA